MKKLLNIFTLFFALILFSCTSEIKDNFDKSAAERIDETINQTNNVLLGASNGWVLQYFPSKDKAFGGYSILVSFVADGTAKVSCDLFPSDKVTVSNYSIVKSNGPILTFDTFNEIFHFFSEPNNDLGLGEIGDGMLGDTDFLILECRADRVVLKGKKTGNKMIMTPIPDNTSWNEYISSVKYLRSQAYPAAYDVLVDGIKKYTVIQKHRKFILVNSDGSSLELPFIYTPTGISLYENVSISGYSAKDFSWDNTKLSYNCENVSFVARELPKNYTKYADFIGKYKFVYSNGDQVTDVSFVEELFNESYIMKGFKYDIRVTYKADIGCIGIEAQSLSGNIYLCVWALSSGGSLSGASDLGVIGKMIDNDGDKIIYLEDNGAWGAKKVDSFIAYDFSSNSSIFQIPYIAGLVKVE
jgi:hypothetical protein